MTTTKTTTLERLIKASSERAKYNMVVPMFIFMTANKRQKMIFNCSPIPTAEEMNKPSPDFRRFNFVGESRFNSDGYPQRLTDEEKLIVNSRVSEDTDRLNLAVGVAMDIVALWNKKSSLNR